MNEAVEHGPGQDDGGNCLGTLEIVHDITDIQKLEGEKRLQDESYQEGS